MNDVGDIRIIFGARTEKNDIRGFLDMSSITSEVLKDMRVNKQNYIGKVIMDKNGVLYKVIDVTDDGLRCEKLALNIGNLGANIL
jgi:hypothetical protein